MFNPVRKLFISGFFSCFSRLQIFWTMSCWVKNWIIIRLNGKKKRYYFAGHSFLSLGRAFDGNLPFLTSKFIIVRKTAIVVYQYLQCKFGFDIDCVWGLVTQDSNIFTENRGSICKPLVVPLVSEGMSSLVWLEEDLEAWDEDLILWTADAHLLMFSLFTSMGFITEHPIKKCWFIKG